MELKKQRNSDSSAPLAVKTLPTKHRGRPLMLCDLDVVVKEYVKQLRTALSNIYNYIYNRMCIKFFFNLLITGI